MVSEIIQKSPGAYQEIVYEQIENGKLHTKS